MILNHIMLTTCCSRDPVDYSANSVGPVWLWGAVLCWPGCRCGASGLSYLLIWKINNTPHTQSTAVSSYCKKSWCCCLRCIRRSVAACLMERRKTALDLCLRISDKSRQRQSSRFIPETRSMREIERGGDDTPVLSVRQEVEYSKLEFLF